VCVHVPAEASVLGHPSRAGAHRCLWAEHAARHGRRHRAGGRRRDRPQDLAHDLDRLPGTRRARTVSRARMTNSESVLSSRARARTHTHTHTHAAHSRRPGPGRAPARRSRGPARPPAPRFRRAAAARTPRTGSRRPRPAAKAYTFIDIDTSRGHQGGADRSRGREATCSMCVLNSKVRATSRSTRIAPHTCATRRRGHQPGGSLRLEHERPVPQSLTSIACDRSRLLSVKVSLSLSLSVSLSHTHAPI